MELDDKIINDAMKKFGIPKEQAEKAIQEMIEDGLFEINDDPTVPFDLKLSTEGAKMAEKVIGEDYGEFKKITHSNGTSYKVPTTVLLQGLQEEDLHHFPLWTD